MGPLSFKSAAKWIADNSKSGEIVFNPRWEYFPEPFFGNTKNVYSAAMDPIFQYAYDPVLYWESDYLTTGKMREFDCLDRLCRRFIEFSRKTSRRGPWFWLNHSTVPCTFV